MRMLRMLKEIHKNILLIKKKKVMKRRQPELKQGQKDKKKIEIIVMKVELLK